MEGLDPARGVGPIIDGTLQAFQPSVRGELRVNITLAEHRVLPIGRIRWGEGCWAQVVVRCSGHRIGGGLFQPCRRMGDGEEEGNMVVSKEGASPIVVHGHRNHHFAVAGDHVIEGARSPLETRVYVRWDQV